MNHSTYSETPSCFIPIKGLDNNQTYFSDHLSRYSALTYSVLIHMKMGKGMGVVHGYLTGGLADGNGSWFKELLIAAFPPFSLKSIFTSITSRENNLTFSISK